MRIACTGIHGCNSSRSDLTMSIVHMFSTWVDGAQKRAGRFARRRSDWDPIPSRTFNCAHLREQFKQVRT